MPLALIKLYVIGLRKKTMLTTHTSHLLCANDGSVLHALHVLKLI